MKRLSVLFLSILTVEILAAGDGGHGSVKDLLWPAINFLILVGGIVVWQKNNLKEMFDKNADDVKDLFEYAEKKDKEANIKLDMYKKKMENLESEKNKIHQNAEKEAQDFIQKAENEAKEYISRLERDSENKILHEKTSLENSLKEDLVSSVISEAKKKIASDKDLNNKATNKLISQIQEKK